MKDFKETLLKQLTNPAVASAYLNEHIQFRGPDASEHLLDAIRNVLRAQGIDQVAKKSGLSRRTLYHAVSKKGNPSVDLFFKILDQLHVNIQFVAQVPQKTKKTSRKAA
jgi:probable addiction module antidote protein